MAQLGFGTMRLPQQDGKIDFAATERMFDRFLEAGCSYVDTAYGYHDFQAEIAVRECLVRRHARDAFRLADKMPMWFVKERADVARLFDEQLQKTGVSYFDNYLLHAMNAKNFALAERTGTWEELRLRQARGQLRHLGFSFHDTAEVLEQALQAHPEVEFVQLQINYADWESARVQARLCYETAERHGCRVIVMEPVRGGALAVLPEAARALLSAAAPAASVASWALRFAASLPCVDVVLSGMSDLAQMEDNLKTFSPLVPLSEAERALLGRVQQILAAAPVVPCTRCGYCTETCPAGIPIPSVFSALNDYRTFANPAYAQNRYRTFCDGKAPASACTRCGMCASRCPQHLDVPELLREAAALFERPAP